MSGPPNVGAGVWIAALKWEVEQNARLYLGIVLPIAKDRHLAEEICQDAFLKACEQTTVQPAAIKPWLIRTMIRLGWRRVKERRRARNGQITGSDCSAGQQSMDHPMDHLDDTTRPGGGFEAHRDRLEMREAFVVAMDQLPLEDQLAITFRFLHELKFEQVAANLGCSGGEAHKRVGEALYALKELMKDSL